MSNRCKWCEWPKDAWLVCRSNSKSNGEGFVCTRHAGHDGPHVACAFTQHALAIWGEGKAQGGTVLIQALKDAREALYNVPEVGEVYDEQHAGTHLRAVARIEGVLRAVGDG